MLVSTTCSVLCPSLIPSYSRSISIPDDFKPLSIDPNRPGRLKVSEDEVNVSLPVGQVSVCVCVRVTADDNLRYQLIN